MEIAGKVAVVTGGGSGIGKALATRFVAEGAKGVVVADMNGDNAAAVAEQLGERAVAVTADVTEEADEVWAATWGVHVLAHVYAARAVVPGMIERGSGYLVNTASAAGLLTNL